MLAGKLDQIADDFSSKTSASSTRCRMSAHARSPKRWWKPRPALPESIAARVDEVNNTLKATGDSLVLDLSLRGGDVVSKLEQTGASITEAITGGGSARVRHFPATRRGFDYCGFDPGRGTDLDGLEPQQRYARTARATPAGVRGNVQPRWHRTW